MSCVKCDANQRDRQGRLCRYCSWKPPAEPSPPPPTENARAGADAPVTDADNAAFDRLAATYPDIESLWGPVKDGIAQALANSRAAGRARGIEDTEVKLRALGFELAADAIAKETGK